MANKQHVYFDKQQRGYIAGTEQDVKDILGYGAEQFKRHMRVAAPSEHTLARRAMKNPGGVYLLNAGGVN